MIITILFSFTSYSRLEKQTISHMNEKLVYFKQNLDLTLKTFMHNASQIAVRITLSSVLDEHSNPDAYETAIMKKGLDELIGSQLSIVPGLVFVEVFDNSGRIWSSPYAVLGDIAEELLAQLKKLGPNEYSRIFILDSNVSQNSTVPDIFAHFSYPVIIGVKILDSSLKKTTGYLILSFDNRVLGTTIEEWETRYIVDEFDRVVYAFPAKDKKELLSPGELFSQQSVPRGFFSEKSLEVQDWKIVSILHWDKLLQDVKYILIVSFCSLIFGIVVIVILSRIVTNSITIPLDELSDSMNKFKTGSLDIRTAESGSDEVTQLSHNFNLMAAKHKQLIHEVYIAQLDRQEEKLRLLQAQINPHFLYNTLDFINWKAYESNHQEICTVVKELSNFYRLSLNRGEEFYKVKDEVELICSYMIIHKLRFPDMVELMINAPKAVLEAPTIKLLLLPLVENSLIHGIAPLTDNKPGQINIKISINNSILTYEVEDNGIGGNIDTFLKPNNKREKKHGFGISNLEKRIKLYFGEDYGLTYRSGPGKGITALVTLPVETKVNSAIFKGR